MPFDPFRGPPQLNEWQRQGIGMVPYVGPIYNALRAGNAIVKGFQGMTGNLPANQALPASDPDYGNPNYIGLGDPTGTPTQPPAYGVTPTQPPAAAPNGQDYAVGPSQHAPPPSVYQTGRFTDAPGFYTTLAQAQFPGSMIGPMGGGNQNAYHGQFFHPGSNSGQLGSTQAWWQDVQSRVQK